MKVQSHERVLAFFLFKRISITLVGPQCDNCAGYMVAHSHALTASFNSVVWTCDGCNLRYSKSHTKFTCAKDNSTFCTKCALHDSQALDAQLLHKHPVAPVKPASDWICATCLTEPSLYVPRFQCTKGCAFEVCGKCLNCFLEVVRILCESRLVICQCFLRAS